MTLKTLGWRRRPSCWALVGAVVFLMTPQRPSRAQSQETNSAGCTETVEVCGLHVVATCDPSSPNTSRGFSKGTTISFLIRAGNERFLQFDENASRISVFVDDQGRNLLDPPPITKSLHFKGLYNPIQDGGKTANIDVNTRVLPTSGTKEIHFEGTLVFKPAGQLETVHSPIRLKAGEHSKLGPIDLQVAEVKLEQREKPGLPQTYNEIRFETQGHDPENIKTLHLLDDSGATISQSFSRSIHRTHQSAVGSFFLMAPRHMQQGTIEITYWEGGRPIEVPVNVTVSAGL